MIEYQIVESATVFPQACFCGSSKGPLIDTMVEIQGRRVYICKLCVKRAARPFAFMPGAKMDELENIGQVLEEKEKELLLAHARNEKQTEANAQLSAQLVERETLLEHYRGLLAGMKNLAGIIGETSRELVSTANGGS